MTPVWAGVAEQFVHLGDSSQVELHAMSAHLGDTQARVQQLHAIHVNRSICI